MKRFYRQFLLLICFVPFAGSAQHLLESGLPIKSISNPAPFALPSINGCLMGITEGSTGKRLFMYGDKFNPGTFYYPFKSLSPERIPIFDKSVSVHVPVENQIPKRSVIVQGRNDEILGFWAVEKALVSGVFDEKANAFLAGPKIKVNNLPASISHFGIIPLAGGRYLFTFTVADTIVNPRYAIASTEPGHRHDLESYGRGGFWQTQLPKTGIYGAFIDSLNVEEIWAKPLTDLDQTYFNTEGYCGYRAGDRQYLLAGSTLGNIHAYLVDEQKMTLSFAGYLKDTKNQTLRNPVIHQYLAYFQLEGERGLLSSGEGGIWYYKKVAGASPSADLVFDAPVHVLQREADLYGGSLVVPELVDWDQDGDLDIVSGNSLGNIQFFENTGSSLAPRFKSGRDLQAGGYTIHIQPGYNQNIQGPYESRWGYASPSVVDWTGDGLPDILTGDSRGKFNVYLNQGKIRQPALEPEHALYEKGMDVHGTWRVKPGVGRMGGRNAYIILDEDDEFHLYWQIDHYNISDAGKLMIGDTMPIRANFRGGGEAGRAKIHIVDWDQDGVKDLLVGAPKYATIPEPKKGMPYRLREKGATILFLRNSGSEAKPVFEYPVPLRHKGKRLNIGHHECAPTTGYLGPGGTLNLVVGDETGRFFFYERKDLQWSPYQEEY